MSNHRPVHPHPTRQRGAGRSTPPPDTLRVRGPGDLVQAVPYLLGFHPSDSLVLVGIGAGQVQVTARIDLSDLADPELVAAVLDALCRGGAELLVAVAYLPALDSPDGSGYPVPAALAERLTGPGSIAAAAELVVGDVLVVHGDRWWSHGCADPACCPTDGHEVSGGSSVLAAEATYAGLVARPDRATLEATLDPLPDEQRRRLLPLIRDQEAAIAARDALGRARGGELSLKRALFAAARAATGDADPAGVTGGRGSVVALDDSSVARFGVALRVVSMRDAVWVAIDTGRLRGVGLWQELARRLPAPYDAAPLFLHAWEQWRAGNGALAGIAAQRAIDSDPHYSAADLLLAALRQGVDPRRLPRLRAHHSA